MLASVCQPRDPFHESFGSGGRNEATIIIIKIICVAESSLVDGARLALVLAVGRSSATMNCWPKLLGGITNRKIIILVIIMMTTRFV